MAQQIYVAQPRRDRHVGLAPDRATAFCRQRPGAARHHLLQDALGVFTAGDREPRSRGKGRALRFESNIDDVALSRLIRAVDAA